MKMSEKIREKITYCRDIGEDIFRSLKEEIFPLPAVRRIVEEFCYVYPAIASAYFGFMDGIADEIRIEYSAIAAYVNSFPYMIVYSILHQDETSKKKDEKESKFERFKQKLKNFGNSVTIVAVSYFAGEMAGYIYKYLLR